MEDQISKVICAVDISTNDDPSAKSVEMEGNQIKT